MRIAIIAPPWVPVPPPAYGGTETVLDSLARGLQVAGHDVLLFATGDSTCEVPRSWVRACAAGTVDTGSATELHHVVNGYERVLAWGPDLIHDHTLAGPVYARRFEIPVVTTNHGPFDGELGDYYRAISADVPIIAISRQHAARAIDTRVAAVIHHGVDVDAFPFGDGDGGYALFLGRMCPDKGVHKAASIARAAGFPLRIAAKMREPAEERYFESQVAPLLGDGIEYLGEVGSAEKLDLLAHAECLLNPVTWPEPFGMVMVEALACGTPVVALRSGSVTELIEHGITGFVHDTDDALIEALPRVDGLDRARCREEAANRFSTARMVADHLALYRSVVDQSRSVRVA